MDLTEVDAKDLSDMGGANVLPGEYIACVDELDDTLSKTHKRMFVADFVIAEGPFKGQKLKHWFVVESRGGKGVFKHFLKSISKDNKAPDKWSDTMRPHCLGRTLRIGVGLEKSGQYLNPRVICMDHETVAAEEFHEKFIRSLEKLEARNEEATAAAKAASKGADFDAAGDVPF